MLFIVFVFFYLFSDHAPWWVVVGACAAVVWDWLKEVEQESRQ